MEHLYDQIEDYLDGLLNAEDQSVFEAALATDEALRERLELQRALRLSVRHARAERDLTETLRQIRQNRQQTQPASQPSAAPLRRIIWFAAAAVLAFAVAGWWLLRPQAPAHETLYAEYRQFPRATFTTQGAAETTGQLRLNAAQAFNRSRYADAADYLRAYLQTPVGAEDQEARFYLALCYLETNQTDAALADLSKLAQSGAWRDEAAWYLALCYLKAGKMTECRDQLSHIGQDNAHFGAAGRLKEDIKGR